MKFLIAGDVHGDLNSLKHLAEKAKKEEVDAIILSGDFTYFDYLTKGTFKILKDSGKKIFIVPGNHESLATTDFVVKKYGVYSLHGYYFDFGDVAIFGAGGANIGPNISTEKEMFSLLEKSFSKIKSNKKKIMITHDFPAKSLVEKITFARGNQSLRKAIDEFKPDFAVFSHMHEAAGIEEVIGNTKLICVGKEGIVINI